MCPNFVVQPLPKHNKYFRPDYDHVRYLAAQITTCGSLKRCTDKTRNPTNFKILKEPLLVQKQTLHQQKSLDLCYLEPEGQGQGIIKRAWLWFAIKELFYPRPTYAFCGERARRPPDNATPSNFLSTKRSRAFCWCVVCFCTSYGSFRILKMAGGNFLKYDYFRNFSKWRKL